MSDIKFNNRLAKFREKHNSMSFEDSRYGEVSHWISTGSYSLNRLISGDIYKGFPAGRLCALNGESATGKSLLAAMCIKDALDQGYKHVFYVDSEGGTIKDFYIQLGCDVSKIDHILVENIEEVQIVLYDLYEMIREVKETNPDDMFLIVWDSLGGCVSEKFDKDSAKGKNTADMGNFAKTCNNILKASTIKSLKTDTALLFTNHVYDDPASLYSSIIKNQRGGKAAVYMPRVSVQCKNSIKKTTTDEANTKMNMKVKKADVQVSGNHIKFMAVKNSFAKPFIEGQTYVHFSKGVFPYFGLVEPAMDYGFIEKAKRGYRVPAYGDKMFTYKDLVLNKDNVWDSFIEDFNEKSKADMAYCSEKFDEDVFDDLEVTDDE